MPSDIRDFKRGGGKQCFKTGIRNDFPCKRCRRDSIHTAQGIMKMSETESRSVSERKITLKWKVSLPKSIEE